MAGGQEKWYFLKEQLQNSASRKCGLDADKELAYRQQAANLIQDMGQRLQVSQLCINTAIVYMHRFYAFHSFTQFHRNAIAAAALFLAAKVEEQPRKLEYVIKVAHVCLHRGEGVNALSTEQYQEQAQDLVFNENVLLQTLGFDVAIDHPHTHVVRACHLVKAPKDLAQTSYFMASNSLHLTTMCLQYRPTVVACFCIHLASKWSNWAIPQSNEGRHWFSYVDRSVTSDLLERLTVEFLHIFDKCPSRLKRKMMERNTNSGSSPHSNASHSGGAAAVASSPFDKKHASLPGDDFDKSFDKEYERERRRAPAPGGYVPATGAAAASAPPPQKIDFNVYQKRDREERERRQALPPRPAAPRPAPPAAAAPPPPHHQRHPPHHQKPHHASWPHHKPPHHKPPEQRPHRPPAPGPSQPPPEPAPTAPPAPPAPQRTRPPSLFSPENSTTPTVAAAAAPRRPQPPPRPRPDPRPPAAPSAVHNQITVPPETQRQPSPHKKRPDASAALREMQPPAILSPFSSPPEVKDVVPKQRQRVHSNSEPELVPVVKKLDETPGYENVIRDSQRGNAIRTKPSEQRRPEAPPVRAVNGIETDPTLVSNLLKESLAKPAPITVATERKSPAIEVKREPVAEPPAPPPAVLPTPEPLPAALPPQPPTEETPEHKHKKEKKKKEKHKHKDRDKSKEERKEERKKHKKDKEREKKQEEPSPPPPAPAPAEHIRITIPRDKLPATTSPSLKLKIPKIKIPKEVFETSRKRNAAPEPGPPQKIPRQNGAPHPKVGWNVPPPSINSMPHLPYWSMVQPPPPFYYGMAMGMENYFYPPMNMYGPPQSRMAAPQPPLPAMPPPVVPPPPPE